MIRNICLRIKPNRSPLNNHKISFITQIHIKSHVAGIQTLTNTTNNVVTKSGILKQQQQQIHSHAKDNNDISVSSIREQQLSKSQKYHEWNRESTTVSFGNLAIKHLFGLFSVQSRNIYVKKKMPQFENDQPHVIAVDEARRFMIDCFVKANVPEKHAKAQADLLIAADVRGHFSHGMNRLEMYINDLLINSTAGDAVPDILKETSATAWVDGKNGLGAVVGEFCMHLAIQKAKTCGVGWVVARRSNHYGIAGHYTLLAEKHGMIGISMTNTSPLMSPTGSKGAALGTNPLSLAAPAKDGDHFCLDMATTTVAVGKIEIQRRKQLPIPIGWAQDPDGHPTTDADLAFKTGCLMPLGGSELTSGYKGYGLGALVEILCGISAGSKFGPHIRKWTHSGADSEADLGQVFIAVDPECFAPGFADRMQELNNDLRGMEPTDKQKPVLVAGDPERIHEKKVIEEGGLRYHPNQIKTCHSLAEKLKLTPIRFVNEV